MYLILDTNNLIAEISNNPCYVRRQNNGVVILSDKDSADAIYSNDTDKYYPIERIGYLSESYHLEETENIPGNVAAGFWFYHAGEFYTTEENLTAFAKSKAPELASIVFVSLAETGELDDTTITEHAAQFSEWGYPINYSVNSICKYENILYRCLQAHTSQENWNPSETPSLWKEIGNPYEEFPEWTQPVGVMDTYAIGDKVSYDEKHWTSICDNNVWQPGIYGWEEVD